MVYEREYYQVKKILLCSGSEKNIDSLTLLIKSFSDVEVITAVSAGEARKAIAEGTDDDLSVVINTPLSDEQGVEMAVQAADKLSVPVLIITGEETVRRSGSVLLEHGITVLSRPVDKKTFICSVEVLMTVGVIMSRLRAETYSLKDSLDEVKLVNRAKAMLISNLNMTEAQAHRYVEKQAMDLRQSKKTIAQNILKTYYNK